MDNDVRRIGILAPPANVALERELLLFLPAGVVTNHNRLTREGNALSRDSLIAMGESVDRAARDLARAYPEIILYGCTSGSFLEGVGKEARLAERITQITGIPAVTTSTAVVEALRALGARRIFMVTPYPDAVNEHELAFCRHHGFEVVALDSFRCPISEDILRISSDDVAARVLGNTGAIEACDTIFVSCTNLLCMDRIELIEARSGRPVVTSNQASLWAALTRMGIDTRGIRAGSLFRQDRSAQAA